MAKVCPTRIIREAMRLLEEATHRDENEEPLDNNLQELEDLVKRLHAAGITAV